METAYVTVRPVYGARKVYPSGVFSGMLADITDTKQVSIATLTTILRYGHHVRIIDTPRGDAEWLRSQLCPIVGAYPESWGRIVIGTSLDEVRT